MKNTSKPQPWNQRPAEPNPRYVAFVLYLSLGPTPDRIISGAVGKQLWRMLMAGIESLQDDTPLPVVCDTISATLQNMLAEDAPARIDKRSVHFPFVRNFHQGLQADEHLLTAIETMLANLEKVRRGQELPRPPEQSGREIVRNVQSFLK